MMTKTSVRSKRDNDNRLANRNLGEHLYSAQSKRGRGTDIDSREPRLRWRPRNDIGGEELAPCRSDTSEEMARPRRILPIYTFTDICKEPNRLIHEIFWHFS